MSGSNSCLSARQATTPKAGDKPGSRASGISGAKAQENIKVLPEIFFHGRAARPLAALCTCAPSRQGIASPSAVLIRRTKSPLVEPVLWDQVTDLNSPRARCNACVSASGARSSSG